MNLYVKKQNNISISSEQIAAKRTQRFDCPGKLKQQIVKKTFHTLQLVLKYIKTFILAVWDKQADLGMHDYIQETRNNKNKKDFPWLKHFWHKQHR